MIISQLNPMESNPDWSVTDCIFQFVKAITNQKGSCVVWNQKADVEPKIKKPRASNL